MTDISTIDSNFKVKTALDREGLRFYNIEESPFRIYGVFKENGKYRRMPERTAKVISEGVYGLHTHTAGGRVRFVTDSPYVAIHAKFGSIGRMPHFTLVGSAGFDMYTRENGREIYSGSFVPPYRMKDGFEGIIEFKDDEYAKPERKRREITINLPTYTEVLDLYIGLDENALVEAPSPYIGEKPIVYYGHSITQGGCVSRPGYVYSAILSRRFHRDFINLGFSGSAKGETQMAEYLAGLDMELLVMDYDYNAPNPEFLRSTHEKMFRMIRAAQPDLPIILLTTTPKLHYAGPHAERVDIVYSTYRNALAIGDQNVFFLNGSTVCDESDGPVGATVEGSHLNDIGFRCLANALEDVIKPLIS